MVISSTPKSSPRRTKPLDQFGVLGFFAISCVIFLAMFLFLYMDFGGVLGRSSAGAGWGFGKEVGGGEEGECDLFDGEWVWDESYPLYDSKDCVFLDEGFRCLENGRPDGFYTKWRWKPKGCVLPRYDFLEQSPNYD